MKVLAVVLMALGLVVAIVPQFTNCNYARSMTAATTSTTMAASTPSTMAGTTPTMTAAAPAKPKCLWTARAELAVGIPLFFMGAFLFLARRKESRRALSALAVLEGIFVILLPTALIGICAKATMTCRTSMEPTLYVAGGLIIALGIASFAWNELRKEQLA